ncbi:hypothetical protein F5Y06DRAFT_47882 [Hypoxylon sp. FL0890]|nr:hypothetical protein F5Y06DRAFT_47882 [Hypoxylon sp. FL0890]
MASNSNKSAYYGVTPPKPSHRFSKNPPTPHPVDKQSLREYRLENYRNGPDSVPLAKSQVTASDNTQTIRQAKLAADLNDIVSRIG